MITRVICSFQTTTQVGKTFGSLWNDDGNGNDNATNRWFYRSNEEKLIVLHVWNAFWRGLPNDDVKFSYLRFERQCNTEAINLSLSAFTWKSFLPSKRKCTSLVLYNVTNMDNRITLNLMQSSVLMWHFSCSSRRSFLNSQISLHSLWGSETSLDPRSYFLVLYQR